MKFPCSPCFSGLRRLFGQSKATTRPAGSPTESQIQPITTAAAESPVCDGWNAEAFHRLMHVEKFVIEYFHTAISRAYPELSPVPKILIAPGKTNDFQINNALSLAKTLQKKPTEVAEAILACLPSNEVIAESSLDTRGFIQVNLSIPYISKYVHALKRLGVSYPLEQRKRVVVDFSSPNIAKDMHVGHLRSTIIGDAMCRMYEFCGHEVHRVNHVGDWGTQFGMLIAYLKQQYPDCLENPPHISDLCIFYKASKVEFDEDPEFKQRAYAEVVSLQSGQADAVKAWNLLCDVSRSEFQVIYDRLNIKLNEFGESFYKDKIPGVLELCETAGLVTTLPDGAKVIMPTLTKHFSELTEKEFVLLFLYAFRNFKEEFFLHEVLKQHGIITADEEIVLSGKAKKKLSEIDWQVDADKVATASAKLLKVDGWFDSMRQILAAKGHVEDESRIKVPIFHYPLIVRKRDGGFTYDTTDLAAIWFRTQVLKADVVRVITDIGQAGHFELINTVAEQMGWSDGVDVGHIGFGLVTGLDGKRFRTRNTDVVKLSDLIDEAVSRCHEISVEKEKEKETSTLSNETIAHNAEVLGIAAVKYHDLKQNRSSNYAFSFDKMCDLDGNSALYLLYSYVRICGIMRKVGDATPTEGVTAEAIEALCAEQPAARALAFQLTRLHAFIDRALEDGMPSRLTDFVYALVCRFTDLYSKVPIKGNPAALALCSVCGTMVKMCLGLLGIDVVERL